MIATQERNQLAEDLRRAMDELCDPGLTMARAEVLRPRVARIIEAIRRSEAEPRDGWVDPPCPGIACRAMACA